ncbi:MAG: M24 family metallopeptidase [Gammaproteobacteria bacterium]|nr:M24 family metallopeptidase [Gammaproteobacteria bacterium]
MPHDRRQFLASAAMAGWAGTTEAAATNNSAGRMTGNGTPGAALPDLSFAQREPFLDRERASRILAAENLDALLVCQGRNVFHVTNFFPLMERMSLTATTLALVPRDPAKPVALIIPAFSYYYIMADDGVVPGVQPYVFTSPADDDQATAPRLYRLSGEASAKEQRRRTALTAAAPYHADMARALRAALRELKLENARIGYDDDPAIALLSKAASTVQMQAAEDTARRIRLVHTPASIRMMRLASQANVEAAHATVAAARSLGSIRAIRQRFYAEAALRGNLGVFMVVNGSSSEAHDEPLREGSAFLIDCVSHLRNFHGDFGRTVFVGEPTARMRYCTTAMSTCWQELQPMLKPGLRFDEVAGLGNGLLRKFGFDVPMTFGPHAVGLAHNDQPRRSADGGAANLVMEENMILSIDMPLFETGSGGTAHLEDLVLITPSGAVPIHAVGSSTYTI